MLGFVTLRLAKKSLIDHPSLHFLSGLIRSFTRIVANMSTLELCDGMCTHVSNRAREQKLFQAYPTPSEDEYIFCFNLLRANCKLLSKVEEGAILKDTVLREKMIEA